MFETISNNFPNKLFYIVPIIIVIVGLGITLTIIILITKALKSKGLHDDINNMKKNVGESIKGLFENVKSGLNSGTKNIVDVDKGKKRSVIKCENCGSAKLEELGNGKFKCSYCGTKMNFK